MKSDAGNNLFCQNLYKAGNNLNKRKRDTKQSAASGQWFAILNNLDKCEGKLSAKAKTSNTSCHLSDHSDLPLTFPSQRIYLVGLSLLSVGHREKRQSGQSKQHQGTIYFISYVINGPLSLSFIVKQK